LVEIIFNISGERFLAPLEMRFLFGDAAIILGSFAAKYYCLFLPQPVIPTAGRNLILFADANSF
jgi:hypothetical protein